MKGFNSTKVLIDYCDAFIIFVSSFDYLQCLLNFRHGLVFTEGAFFAYFYPFTI